MVVGMVVAGMVVEGGVEGGKGVWRRWRLVWRVVAVWTFVFFRGGERKWGVVEGLRRASNR